MAKNKDKAKENFIHAQVTGNLDDGNNETMKIPWSDSVSVAPSKYTLDKNKKKDN